MSETRSEIFISGPDFVEYKMMEWDAQRKNSVKSGIGLLHFRFYFQHLNVNGDYLQELKRSSWCSLTHLEPGYVSQWGKGGWQIELLMLEPEQSSWHWAEDHEHGGRTLLIWVASPNSQLEAGSWPVNQSEERKMSPGALPCSTWLLQWLTHNKGVTPWPPGNGHTGHTGIATPSSWFESCKWQS